jgi:hypothetical protein
MCTVTLYGTGTRSVSGTVSVSVAVLVGALGEAADTRTECTLRVFLENPKTPNARRPWRPNNPGPIGG